MSKLKYFHTREEIVNKIEAIKEQQRLRSIEMEQCALAADEGFKKSALPEHAKIAGSIIVQAQENRSKQKKLLRLLKRTPEKLEALKRTLAAFDTEIMPFETSKGVVMQK